VLLNEDYRSRAIGVVAAIGVLITGVVVTGATARRPALGRSAPQAPPARPIVMAARPIVMAARPAPAPHLEPKCDPVC